MCTSPPEKVGSAKSGTPWARMHLAQLSHCCCCAGESCWPVVPHPPGTSALHASDATGRRKTSGPRPAYGTRSRRWGSQPGRGSSIPRGCACTGKYARAFARGGWCPPDEDPPVWDAVVVGPAPALGTVGELDPPEQAATATPARRQRRGHCHSNEDRRSGAGSCFVSWLAVGHAPQSSQRDVASTYVFFDTRTICAYA